MGQAGWQTKSSQQTQNFSNANLQGQDFSGQDLTNANFSNADIRGANFARALLINCNFTGAKAGLTSQQKTLIFGIAAFLLALASVGGFLTGIITLSSLSDRFISDVTPLPAGILCLSLVVFGFITFRQGFLSGGLAATVTISAGIPMGWGLAFFGLNSLKNYLAGTGPVGLAMACSLLSSLLSAIAVFIILATADTRTQIRMVTMISSLSIFAAGMLTWKMATPFANREGAVERSLSIIRTGSLGEILAAIAIAVFLIALGYRLGKQAIAESENSAFIRDIGIVLTTFKGTYFYGANLTHANFSNARLKNTDFRNAVLIRTNWLAAHQLHLARMSSVALKNPKIRHLVVTRWGKNQIFDDLNLAELNLSQADLEGASLIGANLSNVNLVEADLAHAKLIRTQLADADLRWACLTGAYIQDWGLTFTTQLEGVDCRFIYLRLPTSDNPEPYRKPDNRLKEFAIGEFADFIAPLIKTLDLYHNQNVDPRAIAVAFKELVKNNPEAQLEVISMEKRGRDKFLLKVKTAPVVNRSQLHEAYFNRYNELRSLPSQQLNILLSQEDNAFRSLESMYLGLPALNSKSTP